jgi:hypothetical protein
VSSGFSRNGPRWVEISRRCSTTNGTVPTAKPIAATSGHRVRELNRKSVTGTPTSTFTAIATRMA